MLASCIARVMHKELIGISCEALMGPDDAVFLHGGAARGLAADDVAPCVADKLSWVMMAANAADGASSAGVVVLLDEFDMAHPNVQAAYVWCGCSRTRTTYMCHRG